MFAACLWLTERPVWMVSLDTLTQGFVSDMSHVRRLPLALAAVVRNELRVQGGGTPRQPTLNL